MPQMKYMGPTASKALQILNTQTQMHSTASMAHLPNTQGTVRTSTQKPSASMDAISHSNAPSFQGNLSPATQLQMFKKQSTLDPRINSKNTQILNSPALRTHLYQT